MPFRCLLIVLFIFIYNSESVFAGVVSQIGIRSSSYGFQEDLTGGRFPTVDELSYAVDGIASEFTGAKKTVVWIVGKIDVEDCLLEFNNPGGSYSNIRFKSDMQFNHDDYLTYFDNNNVDVYLQIESGVASVDTLIDLVLTKFGNHSSVKGFGIDVEWYKGRWVSENDNYINETIRITDNQAQNWLNKIKAYNYNYKLFLKHWLPEMMPPTERGNGDIIFIDDSQELGTIQNMISEFTYWANQFPNNPVMYQVGYGSDWEIWANFSSWSSYANPIKAIGEKIALDINNANQDIGILWVDFTLSWNYSGDDYDNFDTKFNYSPEAKNLNITGTIKELETLTANYSYYDNEGDLEAGSSFQWYLAEDVDGTGFIEILGATNSSYTIQTDNVGKYICFSAIPMAASGVTEGRKFISSYYGPIETVDNSLPCGQEACEAYPKYCDAEMDMLFDGKIKSKNGAYSVFMSIDEFWLGKKVAPTMNYPSGIAEGVSITKNGIKIKDISMNGFYESSISAQIIQSPTIIATNEILSPSILVNGLVKAKEIKVTNDGWADYVFDKDYKLRSLKETEQYINENGHLPDIPSAKEIKRDGINIGKIQEKLLAKIEELTLHCIKLEKKIEILQKGNN